MIFVVMGMISTRVHWQDPSLNALQVVTTSFGFRLRECMESSSPHPRDYYLL